MNVRRAVLRPKCAFAFCMLYLIAYLTYISVFPKKLLLLEEVQSRTEHAFLTTQRTLASILANTDNNLGQSMLRNKDIDVYEVRKRNIREVCSHRDKFHINFLSENTVIKNHLIYYPAHQITFCQIFKVGSTNVNRILNYMDRSKMYDSPFDIALLKLSKKYFIGNSISSFSETLNATLKTLFVRNPYYRLFSGYIDKIYFTDTFYWKVIGKQVISRFRSRKAPTASRCGSGVTFPEIVKYVISGGIWGNIDEHFRPMHKHCLTCDIDYDIIGKMETFEEDIKYIWQSVNRTIPIEPPFPELESSTEIESIEAMIKVFFSQKDEITKCISCYTGMEIVWKSLQMRGMLGKNNSMPFTEEDSKTITQDDFINKALDALKHSGSRNFRRKCKEEALVEAYSMVPMEDLKRLKEFFKIDCEMFGYELEPSIIFDRSNRTK